MGTAYRNSKKRLVDEKLREFGDYFAVEWLVSALDVGRPTISSVLVKYKKQGVIERVGNGEYRIIHLDKIGGGTSVQRHDGEVHGPVRHLPPPQQSGGKNIADTPISLAQLGESVYELLRSQKKEIERLRQVEIDLNIRITDTKAEYREIIAQKDELIESYEEKIGLLRDKVGTFTLAEMAH